MQADPMQQAWDNRSPLHFAAQHRYPAVIRQLLLHPSLRETPSSATQHPSGSAMQHPPTQPVLQQHQHAPDAEQHQDQDMVEDALLSDAHSQLQESHNAQTDADSKQILQQADRYDEHASIQDAASSLQSLQSGIQYEPNPGANVSEETDTTSDGTLDDAEQLDYTGQDAEALQALLALTNDCSVQSPLRARNPAGDSFQPPRSAPPSPSFPLLLIGFQREP